VKTLEACVLRRLPRLNVYQLDLPFYTPRNRVATTIDPRSNKTQYFHDQRGHLDDVYLCRVEPAGVGQGQPGDDTVRAVDVYDLRRRSGWKSVRVRVCQLAADWQYLAVYLTV